jgi:hypothetical protein
LQLSGWDSDMISVMLYLLFRKPNSNWIMFI